MPGNIDSLKLRRLRIRQFKAIDSLDIEFPAPESKFDPDITVLGSRNGAGKTSVLEACALLCNAIRTPPVDTPRYPGDLLVRADADSASIEAELVHGKTRALFTLIIDRNGKATTTSHKMHIQALFAGGPAYGIHKIHGSEAIQTILGYPTEPFIDPPLLYFHSYRKVLEGSPELGAMFRETNGPGKQQVFSAFKLELVLSLMSQAGIFENADERDASDSLAQLNNLLGEYAGGRLAKLRSSGNQIEPRIEPANGGPSFPFDGLSSGQKEVVSTLFLIWKHTRNQPGIVLIDEPELHLNAEWHRSFVKSLHAVAPDNQYILATHSEEVFASVDERQRILLAPDSQPVVS